MILETRCTGQKRMNTFEIGLCNVLRPVVKLYPYPRPPPRARLSSASRPALAAAGHAPPCHCGSVHGDGDVACDGRAWVAMAAWSSPPSPPPPPGQDLEVSPRPRVLRRRGSRAGVVGDWRARHDITAVQINHCIPLHSRGICDASDWLSGSPGRPMGRRDGGLA